MEDAEESLDAKLAKARQAKIDREQTAVDAAKARELEALELEEKYTAVLGTRHVTWDMLTTSEGTFIVKLGEPVLWKRIRAKFKGDNEPTIEEIHGFVMPCLVYPSIEKFLEITGRRVAVATVLAGLLADLYGAKEIDTRGK
jgi:hypothetical protein